MVLNKQAETGDPVVKKNLQKPASRRDEQTNHTVALGAFVPVEENGSGKTESLIKPAYHELDEIFKLITSSMRIVDMHYNVLRVNNSMERLSKLPADIHIRKKCFEGFPGEYCHSDMCTLKLIHAGKEVYEKETLKKNAAGKSIPCALNAKPLYDERGHTIAILQEFRDLTEQKRLESIAQAVNTMNNIGYVFSGIRHELGNPINSIKTALSVLDHKLFSMSKETIKDYVDRMLRQIARMEYLLKSMRSFNQYETPTLARVHLNSFMTDIFNLVKTDSQRTHVELVRKLAPTSLYTLADPRALQQVMLNVISNALDAMEHSFNPKLTFETIQHDKIVEIKITDNGCGIHSENLNTIFTPFFTTKKNGTGLGLVIVKNMLTQMGASIEIRSKIDLGTAVSIYLREYQADDAANH